MDNLDAFDRAGLQLSDKQKQEWIDLVNAYRAAGRPVTLDMLIGAVARDALRAGGNVEASSPPECSVAISAEGGT